MKTVRRLLWREVLGSVAFVTLAFLSLFFFIDFVGELDDMGKAGRSIGNVLGAALLEVPGNLYELFPITVLIGSIYALARLAQGSEFTILRTGGLGPWRALSLLAALGLGFSLLTFSLGEWLMPVSEAQATMLRAQAKGGLSLGRTGAWLKERRQDAQGERSISVNVAAASGQGTLRGVRIFEMDADNRLVRRIEAAEARVGRDGIWQLRQVRIEDWPRAASGGAAAATPPSPAASAAKVTQAAAPPPAPVQLQTLPEWRWASSLSADVVQAAVVPLKSMSTQELWRYSRHLDAQEQAAQQYLIQFWKKALYPLACLVMVALALPFAYLHARAGGVSLKVFGGIMLGISFVLLNNLASHIGMLRNWEPLVAAAMPGLAYLLLSMAAFAWLVRYR
jgi:lipopolysaccharide export system permease protein